MLASITPLGERGRQSRWPVTTAAFLLGAVLAGAAGGAALGALGHLVLPATFGSRGRLAVLGAGLLTAVALDALPARVPGPRRQVNEHWLDEFRGWVYGLGFGAQLGLGVDTVVTSAATYAALLAALLSGSSTGGLLIGACYGAVRGLTPLAGAHVHRPEQLFALHARLERWRLPVLYAAPVLLAALAVAAGVGTA
jgi:hypothetical protein